MIRGSLRAGDRPILWRALPAAVVFIALFILGCSKALSHERVTTPEPRTPTVVERCRAEVESQGVDNCPSTAADVALYAGHDIDSFWQTQFQAASRVYEAPSQFLAYSQPVETACGEAQVDNAFFCPVDHAIYYDPAFLGEEFGEHGEYAPVFMLAHEWGHLVQANLGILRDDSLYSIQLELQADCLAGVYFSDARARSIAGTRDLDSAVVALFDAGDDFETPWNDPRAHGTAGQRIDAFNRGYTQGMYECLD